MMGEKHYLHELLKENQEPFLLNKYISDRRSQMIKSSRQNYYSTNIKQPIINSSNLFTICKNSSSCLFSFPETPDNITKSPVLFQLPSPQKSPCKSPNKIFLHINSRTASLLLEAALRIQKDSSSTSTLKTKTKTKGFGLFGSLFKRLTQRNHNRNRNDKDKMDSEPEKEMETSCSGQFYDSEEIIHFVTNHQDSVSCQSPFRFVLQTSSCSGTHTPELASPSRHVTEDKESKRAEESSAKQLKRGEELDKEQFSPVCVLDPPFEDDDDDEEAHGNEDDGDPDLESSYAIVQRARQQILYKLRRFEKLAELDPVELEKRMQDDYENEEEEDMETSIEENEFPEQVFEAVFTSSTVLHHDEKQQIPQEFKKLISDLIMEEEKELNNCSEDREMVMSRICKRLELWKEVECNTIDMMIEEDFCREDDVGWRKKNVEQITEMAGEVEIAIFGFLVEEFSEELVVS